MKRNTAPSAASAARRARPLVGLLVPLGLSACIVDLRTSYPLVDDSGAPACGNIGQVGRPRPQRLLRATAAVMPPIVAPAPGAIPSRPQEEPRVAAVLLGPPPGEDAARAACAARPLVDGDACDPACGNIPMKTGGCHRGH